MKVRNKTLCVKIERFLMATIELLKKIEASEGLPIEEVTTYSFGKGMVEAGEESRIDFSRFVFKHSKEIDKLLEFVDCAKYILSNKVTRKEMQIFDDDGRPVKEVPLTLDSFHMVYSFLVTYLRRNGKLSFVKELFREIYEDLEKYLYPSTFPYKVTAPLEGVYGSTEVNFGNNLKLRRLSDSEKNAYMETMETSFGLGYLDIMDIDYTLETAYLNRKGTAIDTSSCIESFNDVVTTLRLFKPGKIGFDVVKREPSSWHPSTSIGYSLGFSRQWTIFPNSYELSEFEKSDLSRLWNRLKSFKRKAATFKDYNYINIAIKRFNLGIEEKDAENKMIEFLIALEALYLLEVDELAYRLSNRAAILLGKNDVNTEEIRKFMARAYNLRSKIVHGKDVGPIKIEGTKIELNNFVQTVEEYLRKSLKSFIALAKTLRNQERILEFLDKSLIDSKSRKKLREMIRHAQANV